MVPCAWLCFLPGPPGHQVENIAAAATVTGTVPAGTEGCRQQGSGQPAGGDVGRSKPASSKPAATAREAGALLGARGWPGRTGQSNATL